jgi:hypothetical protein
MGTSTGFAEIGRLAIALQPVEGRTPYSRGVAASASHVVDIHEMDVTPWISTRPDKVVGG